MRGLLASTSFLVLALVAAQPAQAQRSITTAITTPIDTATATNGGPDNVSVTSTGSITVTSGAAITVSTANNVDNAGTLSLNNASNSDGILVTTGGPANITNSGTITNIEDYTATDTDNDGDLDGSFAQGSNRFGIRTTGALTGNITNSGTITIEGNDSGGIKLGGPLTGAFSSTGTITVTGDRGIGIQTRDVTGNVYIAGTVGVLGANSVGVAIDGNVTGTLVLQGSIVSTGYRYTSRPTDVTMLDADDLLQGGPAARITGNVTGGILLDIPPTLDSTNPDVDGDGITDTSEGSASLSSFGAAPALLIGGSGNITIGSVSGATNGEGLVIKGTVSGTGLYDGVNAYGVVVGGQGGTVNLSGGVLVSGTVTGANYSNGTGTALLINSGVTTSYGITVSGIVSGQAGANGTAQGILIQSGAVVPNLTISGGVGAGTGDDGNAIAIRDLSGTLTTISNSGIISTTATNETTGSLIAIDVSANTTGVTIRNANTAATGTPNITGAILFGSGNDLLDIARGTVTGNVTFGAGNNSLTLENGGGLTGNATFGAGADSVVLTGLSHIDGTLNFGGGADVLTIGNGTRVTGTITNATGLTATVNGALNLNSTAPISIASLQVGSTGVIGITVNSTSNVASQINVAGAASFDAGAKVQVSLSSVSNGAGTYRIVNAGSLSGASNLTLSATALPYLFNGTLTANTTAGTVDLAISRKTASQLGFNQSQTAAYDAVFAVVDQDTAIRDVFLADTSAEQVRRHFGTFLPEHSGGLFQNATLAARAASRALEDRPVEFGFGAKGTTLIVNSVVWSASKSTGATASYDLSGWGAEGGLEFPLGQAGRIGFTLGAFLGLDKDGDQFNSVETNQYQVGIHWRLRQGGLSTLLRATYARLDFNGERIFDASELSTGAFRRTSTGSWGGNLFGASATASYEIKAGQRLSFRPRISGDYYRLDENSYSQTGGGAAFDLKVNSRSSNELAAEGSVTVGYDLNQAKNGASRLRIELEGGERTILSGSIGSTTATFGTGQSFTLLPDARKDGWLGRFRLIGGSTGFTFGAEAGAEDQAGRVGYTFRAAIQVGW